MKRLLQHLQLWILLVIAGSTFTLAQNNTNTTCAEALPVCPDNNFGRNIVSEVGDELTGEEGPDYGCLGTEPNPLWYYMRVSQTGTAIFDLEQWTGLDQTGELIDVDFAVWGPFDSEDNCGNLTTEMLVDSSYDPTGDETIDFYNGDGCGPEPTENAQVVNAGEVYILVITNFSRRAGYINLVPREEMTATFDCSILGPTYEFCDYGGDGVETVDLNNYVNEISEGDPNIAVTFHATSLDANNYTNFIEANQTLTEETLTVYARKEDVITGEVTVIIISFTLIPEPELQEATLIACDSNGDGVELFDLTQGNVIVNPEDEMTLSYYLSQEDADNSQNAIEDPTYYSSGNADIIVRADAGDCYATTILHLELLDTLELMNASTTVCDEGNDGVETFNLTDFNSTILNNNTGNIQYYVNESDALAGNDNYIQNPESYESGSTTLYAYVSGESGCNATASLEIVLSSVPELTDGLMYDFCDSGNDGSETIDLTAVLGDLISNSSGMTVEYYLNEADALAGNSANAISNPSAYQLTGSTQIYVRVYLGECQDVAMVTFNLLDGVAVTDDTLYTCFDASGNGTFDLTTAEVTTVSTISYHTSLADATTGNNPIPNPTAYTSSVPGTVYVYVDAGDCTSTATITLAYFEQPQINIPDTFAICSGYSAQVDAGASFTAFNWSTGESTQSIEIDELGNYWVDVTDANGCTFRHNFEVIAGIAPTIVDAIVGQDMATIMAEGGEQPYQYSIGGFVWQDSNVFTNLTPGTYNILVRGADGCVSAIEIMAVFEWPTLFTPNGDGHNDIFNVPGLNVYPGSYVRIYDRYGALMHEGEVNSNAIWDGRDMSGNIVPTQDYWYILDVSDGRRLTGHITVKNRTEKGK